MNTNKIGFASRISPLALSRAGVAFSTILFVCHADAGTADSFNKNTELTTAGNYASGNLPSNTTDVLLTTPSTVLTITTASLTMESLSATDGVSYTITGAGTAGNSLTLGNSAGFSNAYSGTSNDLIYLAGGSNLTINPGASTTLGLTVASSGNFDVGSTSMLSISSALTGATGIALNVSGGGTVTLSGVLTAYTGTLGVSAGTLNLSQTSGTDNIFAAATGGGFVGNLVIANAIRVNFQSGIFGGGGQVQVQTTGTTLTNSNGTPSAGPGTVSNAVVLNSNLAAFTAGTFSATTPFYTTASFVTAIGGTTTSTSTNPITFSGVISGKSDVSIANSTTGGGGGPVVLGLAGTNGGSGGYETYTGNTLFNGNGTVTLAASNVLPTSTNVIEGTATGIGTPKLSLNGFNQTVGSISDGSAITGTKYLTIQDNATANATLTFGNATTPPNPAGFTGAFVDGTGTGLLALAKTGTDTILLTGSHNAFSGGVTVNQGTLTMTGTNTDAIGTGAIVVNPTATTGTANDAATLNTNNSAIGNTGAPVSVYSNSTSAIGTINFTSGAPAIGSLSGNGSVVLQNSSGTALTIGSTNNLTSTFSGTISEGTAGKGSLTKAGTGTLTLSGTNTYTGATALSAGTLLVNGTVNSSAGGVSVASGGTLGGTGTLGGSTTINSGGTITGGTAGTIGTLNLATALTINGTYLADIIAGTGTGSGSDTLNLTGGPGVGALTLGNASTLNLAVQGTPVATQYVLAAYASLSGTFATVTGTPSGYNLDYGTVTPGEITLDMTSVPEPATWFGGLLLLGTVGISQRRRFQGLRRLAEVATLPMPTSAK